MSDSGFGSTLDADQVPTRKPSWDGDPADEKPEARVLKQDVIDMITSVQERHENLKQHGKFDEAESAYRQLLSELQNLGLDEHLESVGIKNNLADFLIRKRKHEEAEDIYRRNIISLQEILGPDHQTTLATRVRLTQSLCLQEKWDEAENVYKDLLPRLKRTYGEEDSHVLDCLIRFHEILGRRRSYQETESVIREAYRVSCSVSGKGSPDTIRLLHEIGCCMMELHRYDEAEASYRRALDDMKEEGFTDNVTTVATLRDLGRALQLQCKFSDAEQSHREALRLVEQGPESLSIRPMEIRQDIAIAVICQGKLAEGEKLLQQVLSQKQKTLGKRHASTIHSMMALGESIHRQGRNSEAEKHLREALQLSKEACGESSVLTQDIRGTLANILRTQGRFQESVTLHEEALAVKTTGLGRDNLSTTRTMNQLAEDFLRLGRPQDALELHREELEIRERRLGSRHLDTLASRNDLAATLMTLERWNDAEHILRNTTEVAKDVTEQDLTVVLTGLNHLSVALDAQGKFREREGLLQEIEGLKRQHPGYNNASTLVVKQELAANLLRWGKLAEAEAAYRELTDATTQVLGPDHPSMISILTNVGLALRGQEKFDQAEPILREAVTVSTQILGAEHEQTTGLLNSLALVLYTLGRDEEAAILHRNTFEIVKTKLEDGVLPTEALQPNKLCSLCLEASTSPLQPRRGRTSLDRHVHHSDMASLTHYAKFCPMCATIRDVIREVAAGFEDHEIRTITITGLYSRACDADDLQELGLHLRSVYFEYKGQKRGPFFNFLAKMDVPRNAVTSRAIYKPSLSSQELVTERLALLKSWFRGCLRDHLTCIFNPTPFKPTRLIDLGLEDDQDPVLVDTASLSPSTNTYYVALSHCWGSSLPEEAMTTADNIADRQRRINASSLPRTYRDALEVTKAVGIRFLWIDSLCIIQGDEKDWAKEAASIARVFQECVLVVAAAGSPNAHGGCSLDKHAQPNHLQYTTPEGEKSIEFRIPALKHTFADIGASSLKQDTKKLKEAPPMGTFEPLSKRAWALQETILAPRLVYMTSNQFYWQCQTCTHSEDGLVRDNRKYRFDEYTCIQPHTLSDAKTAREHWWAWVMDYSSRELSYESDYVAAIAGLMQYFSEHAGVEPVLGLWKDDLFGAELGWTTHDFLWKKGRKQEITTKRRAPRRSEIENAPSWSWFRYRTPIHGHPMASPCLTIELDVLNFDVKWAGTPLTSKLLRSELIVSGKVAKVSLLAGEEPDPAELHQTGQEPLLCLLDDPTSTRNQKGPFTAPCLLLSLQPTQGYGTFLVMEEVGSKQGGRSRYQRIGVGHFGVASSALRSFDNAGRAILELI